MKIEIKSITEIFRVCGKVRRHFVSGLLAQSACEIFIVVCFSPSPPGGGGGPPSPPPSCPPQPERRPHC